MFRLGIKNFQSIRDLDLTVEGFTTLVGKSNIGKSSVIRAIKGLLQNAEGDFFVREGESYTEVELECPELHAIWRKGGPKNDYEFPRQVDGGESKKLLKVGRGSPPDIAEAGFREIAIGRDSLNVQVADQFQPIFLLDQTGPTAAEVLCDVGRLSDIQEALKQAESDRRASKDRLRVRIEDLEEVEKSLGAYEGLEDAMRQVKEARSFYDDVRRIEREVDRIELFVSQADECRDVVEHFSGAEAIEIPEWDGDEDLNELRRVDRLLDAYEGIEVIVDRFSGVETVEIPEWDGDDDFEFVRSLEELSSLHDDVQTTVNRFAGLSEVQIPDDELDEDLRELRRLRRAVDLRDELASEIRLRRNLVQVELPGTEELEKVWGECSELTGMADDFQGLAEDIRGLRRKVDELSSQIEEQDRLITSIFAEAGACPTCERGVGA